MGSRRVNLFVVLFVLGLLVGSGVVIASQPTVLGLDLRGGTQLVYEAQGTPANPDPTPEDVDRAIEIVRDRVDSLGVAEPEISRVGAQSIQIGLPNVQDTSRAVDRVGDTAQLFFYDLEPNVIPVEKGTDTVTAANLERQTTTSLYDAVKLASEQPQECDNCTASGSIYYLFDSETEDLVAGPEQDRADLFADPEAEALPKNQREVIEVKQGTIVVRDSLTSGDRNADSDVAAVDRYFVLHDRPSLSGDDLRNPEQNFDPQTNEPNVTFDFTDKGRQIFQEVTRAIAERGLVKLSGASPHARSRHSRSCSTTRSSRGRSSTPRRTPMASTAVPAPRSRAASTSPRPRTSPSSCDRRAADRAQADLAEHGLGDARPAGARSGAACRDRRPRPGPALPVGVYRFLGLVAALGLIVYAIFFFALLKLIPITLTLPGIAGLILTIGVAADSNIVIFERIKEEARAGHSMISAITTGYRKGIATIIDANVITLLTAFVLFGLATGGVKGFAFTLGVGILVSLFTAVVFTRAVLGLLSRSRLLENPKLVGAGKQRLKWHFDFSGASKWFFSFSGAILVIGALAFATSQLNFGIDFESGTKIKAALSEEVDVGDVRSSLADAGVEEPDAAKIQEVGEPDFGDNVVQIQGKIDPTLVGRSATSSRRTSASRPANDRLRRSTTSRSARPSASRSPAAPLYAIIFSLLLIAPTSPSVSRPSTPCR